MLWFDSRLMYSSIVAMRMSFHHEMCRLGVWTRLHRIASPRASASGTFRCLLTSTSRHAPLSFCWEQFRTSFRFLCSIRSRTLSSMGKSRMLEVSHEQILSSLVSFDCESFLTEVPEQSLAASPKQLAGRTHFFARAQFCFDLLADGVQ